MFKQLFEFSSNGNGSARIGEHRNGSVDPAVAGSPGHEKTLTRAVDDTEDFDQIYRTAAVKPPSLPYGILKVVEMMHSQHISGLPADARRSALLMALEAVGAEIEDLLQDAVVRQRALNDYEQQHLEKLDRFEAAKVEENRGFQAELDRLNSQYLARVQANLDEVAREQDKFRAWQARKQQEVQRIAGAAAICVPDGMAAHPGSLAGVLERACAARR